MAKGDTHRAYGETLWGCLATVAGLPEGQNAAATAAKNRKLWNGLLLHLLGPDALATLTDATNQPVSIDKLSADDLALIRRRLARKQWEMPDLSGSDPVIDLSRIRFPVEIDFNGFVFPIPVTFENSIFEGNARFTGAVFGSRVNAKDLIVGLNGHFEQVSAADGLDLTNGNFRDYTSFWSASFGGVVRLDSVHLQKGSCFAEVRFAADATFVGARLAGDTDFSSAEFLQDVVFRSTMFLGPASFKTAKFDALAKFQNSEFHSNANFQLATFAGWARFEHSNFNASAVFSETTFQMWANFESAEFAGMVSFGGTTFGSWATFTSAKFLSPVAFPNASFRDAPVFFETCFHEDTDWGGVTWPGKPTRQRDGHQYVRRYERLALIMSDLKKYEDEHFFFRKAMQARRIRDGRSVSSAVNWFYEFACDYGHGIGRALALWLGWIGLTGILLWSMVFRNGWQPGLGANWNTVQPLIDLRDAMLLSFANCHAFLGLTRWTAKPLIDRITKSGDYSQAAIDSLHVISGVQTVGGVITLFFLLLTLRNRFKMH